MPSVLDDMIGQAFELDESLRDRVIKLAHMALNEAEMMIKHGDPAMKSRIINQFLRTFSKYMEQKGTNDEIEHIKGVLEDLRGAVMGRIPGELGVGDVDGEGMMSEDEVEVDGPK